MRCFIAAEYRRPRPLAIRRTRRPSFFKSSIARHFSTLAISRQDGPGRSFTDDRFPTVAKAWRRRWAEITPFLAYPEEMRRAIYTTNAVEAMNRNLRKALKNRGHMPNEQAALKLLYLALRHERKGMVRRARYWNQALNQFAIHFEGRLPA